MAQDQTNQRRGDSSQNGQRRHRSNSPRNSGRSTRCSQVRCGSRCPLATRPSSLRHTILEVCFVYYTRSHPGRHCSSDSQGRSRAERPACLPRANTEWYQEEDRRLVEAQPRRLPMVGGSTEVACSHDGIEGGHAQFCNCCYYWHSEQTRASLSPWLLLRKMFLCYTCMLTLTTYRIRLGR